MLSSKESSTDEKYCIRAQNGSSKMSIKAILLRKDENGADGQWQLLNLLVWLRRTRARIELATRRLRTWALCDHGYDRLVNMLRKIFKQKQILSFKVGSERGGKDQRCQ